MTVYPLDRLRFLPYEIELRVLLDASLYTLDQLEAAAKRCCALDAELQTGKGVGPEALAAKIQEQTRIFYHLESFLTAYARLSLLIFPTSHTTLARARKETMQMCLGVTDESALNDRELRDAWAHHDERLDAAVAAQPQVAGHVFKRASHVTASDRQRFLRIIEIDSLVVHYHDRHNTPKSFDVRTVRPELEALEAKRGNAFSALPIPDDNAAY